LKLINRSVLSSAALAAALWFEPASAQSLETGLTAHTPHHGVFEGQAVQYDAIVETSLLPGADGETAGRLVTTSYVAQGAGDASERPVLFLFNGGPGASTTPLHFSAFGPMRRFGDGESAYLQPNPDSLLDRADLVFIDPVGTGFSIPESEDDGAQFWSREGDARSVADVIAAWLERHDRTVSPRFVLGQSYGTIRAAEIARLAPELDLDGVLLFALVPDGRGEDTGYALSFPSMAATAWYHQRIDRDDRSVTEVFDAAVAFVEDTYLPALEQGDALPETEAAALAETMSGFLGLPADFITEKNLRLSNRDFMFALLEDEGLRTGQLDARATARLDAPAQRPPYDDPGLSYHPGEPTEPEGEPALRFDPEAHDSIVEAYYDTLLGFDPERPYRALNLDVNAAWDHQDWRPIIPHLAAAMQADPELTLFWAAGLYDLSTPAYGGRYALDQGGVPADRLTAAYFPAGHSVFVGEDNRALLGDAVRTFLSAQD
jgi:carboxypeptidase C (cathepsin A)